MNLTFISLAEHQIDLPTQEPISRSRISKLQAKTFKWSDLKIKHLHQTQHYISTLRSTMRCDGMSAHQGRRIGRCCFTTVRSAGHSQQRHWSRGGGAHQIRVWPIVGHAAQHHRLLCPIDVWPRPHQSQCCTSKDVVSFGHVVPGEWIGSVFAPLIANRALLAASIVGNNIYNQTHTHTWKVFPAHTNTPHTKAGEKTLQPPISTHLSYSMCVWVFFVCVHRILASALVPWKLKKRKKKQ